VEEVEDYWAFRSFVAPFLEQEREPLTPHFLPWFPASWKNFSRPNWELFFQLGELFHDRVWGLNFEYLAFLFRSLYLFEQIPSWSLSENRLQTLFQFYDFPFSTLARALMGQPEWLEAGTLNSYLSLWHADVEYPSEIDSFPSLNERRADFLNFLVIYLHQTEFRFPPSTWSAIPRPPFSLTAEEIERMGVPMGLQYWAAYLGPWSFLSQLLRDLQVEEPQNLLPAAVAGGQEESTYHLLRLLPRSWTLESTLDPDEKPEWEEEGKEERNSSDEEMEILEEELEQLQLEVFDHEETVLDALTMAFRYCYSLIPLILERYPKAGRPYPEYSFDPLELLTENSTLPGETRAAIFKLLVEKSQILPFYSLPDVWPSVLDSGCYPLIVAFWEAARASDQEFSFSPASLVIGALSDPSGETVGFFLSTTNLSFPNFQALSSSFFDRARDLNNYRALEVVRSYYQESFARLFPRFADDQELITTFLGPEKTPPLSSPFWELLRGPRPDYERLAEEIEKF
jgi:hypothetical protein